jgi:hypothetical protein
MHRLSILLVLFALVLNLGFAHAAEEIGNLGNKTAYRHMLLDISQVGPAGLAKFKGDKNMSYWCELDNDFFITYISGKRPVFPPQAVAKNEIMTENNLSEPMLAMKIGKDSPLDEFAAQISVIYDNGAHTIFQAPPNVLKEIAKKESNHFKLESMRQNLPVAVNIRYIEIPDIKSAETVSVNLERLKGYIKTFEDFKTRYSYSQGYLDAANFAVEEFKKMGLEAKLVEYTDGGKKQYNVVAQKKSAPASKDDKFYVVGGHLDSTSPVAATNAPGADDNASGSSGAMEVANIISKYPFADKVRFVLFAGEELGLRGSKAYVAQLKASGEIKNVLGMVNLDMIGFDKVAPISSMWQTKQEFHPFVDNFLAAAKEVGKLKITMSYSLWGSDHVSFATAGVPAFLFIEDEYGSNPNYHKVTDRLETLNPEMLREFVRIVAQGLVNMLSTAAPAPAPAK